MKPGSPRLPAWWRQLQMTSAACACPSYHNLPPAAGRGVVRRRPGRLLHQEEEPAAAGAAGGPAAARARAAAARAAHGATAGGGRPQRAPAAGSLPPVGCAAQGGCMVGCGGKQEGDMPSVHMCNRKSARPAWVRTEPPLLRPLHMCRPAAAAHPSSWPAAGLQLRLRCWRRSTAPSAARSARWRHSRRPASCCRPAAAPG